MLVTTSSKIKRERLDRRTEQTANTRCTNLQLPLNVNKVVKYMKTKWLVHAGRFGKINAYQILTEKPEGQNLVGRYRSRCGVTWAGKTKLALYLSTLPGRNKLNYRQRIPRRQMG